MRATICIQNGATDVVAFLRGDDDASSLGIAIAARSVWDSASHTQRHRT